MRENHRSYWQDIWKKFWEQKSGVFGSIILIFFVLLALYAPFLASSKPIALHFGNDWYFPLFRYYFSSSFYSKGIDLFFNVLGVGFPLYLLSFFIPRSWRFFYLSCSTAILCAIFLLFSLLVTLDPANDSRLAKKEQAELVLEEKAQADLGAFFRPRYPFPSFTNDLLYMNRYAKLNFVLDAYLLKEQNDHIQNELAQEHAYTLYNVNQEHIKNHLESLTKIVQNGLQSYGVRRKEENTLRKKLFEHVKELAPEKEKKLAMLTQENRDFEEVQNRLWYIQDKEKWLNEEIKKISYILMPLIRPFHWEDDAGGDQALNLKLGFLDLSRINRQDLLSALIFGARISLFVGILATLISLAIGIPLGLISGFYGAKVDIILCRLVEVWESMPAFFMLLLIVTLLETKSIFLIISVIALFSWTTSFRFVRAETFRQREMLYVDAGRALGFSDSRILFCHLLANSIVPVIALLPFDMMGAITREAGLAFLGLGEEQSCSWGELMDEGRAAFPAESALLWPPAIALTILLIGIAFVGDALHNAMDPKAKS